jgi:hypothetical protein
MNFLCQIINEVGISIFILQIILYIKGNVYIIVIYRLKNYLIGFEEIDE